MEESRISLVFTAGHGTAAALAADVTFPFELPYAFMPRHISAVSSTASTDATVAVGTSADPDAVLTAQTIGSSDDPEEFEPSDFADADYQYAKGDIMLVTISVAGDTDPTDVTIVVTGLTGE